jgi:iron complex outermembrane receptor protein
VNCIADFAKNVCNRVPQIFVALEMTDLHNSELCLAALIATLGSLIFVTNAFPQETAGVAEVERVIVTGSNIPTAAETGPNPLDTYRPADIEKLGIRNPQDLRTFLPQEAGGTGRQLLGASPSDGTVQINLRGLLPKETLVLVDGKRVAFGSLGVAGFSQGVDINLIPFPMIDHIDILKDGASAVYGADAVAGVVNFFLIHKFRGLEIGGSYGNTNLGASNDMGEWEAWIKAGTGDDKTDMVVIADFWERTGGIFSRDRDLSANAFYIPFGGFDDRSGFFPGRIGRLRLTPKLFFSANSPPPHSAPNAATSPFYKNPFAIAPNAYPGPPGINNARVSLPQSLGNYGYKGGGDYFLFNFAAVTSALPTADRQSYYGSFTRDICDKYLQMFADFKLVRSFFDSSLAALPFILDPFKAPGLNVGLSAVGISVPISNPFNPFTVADTTVIINGVPTPMTTGVRFRGLNDTGNRSEKFTYWDSLFDVGLKGEMGEFGDYFNTWNWEACFRYARNEGQDLSIGEVSQIGLREALVDTNPATAFNPFLGLLGRNSKAARSKVYVTLHNSGEFELPLGYLTINGDLFNLPAGPISFAIGGEYRGERMTRDRDALNSTFQSLGPNGQGFRVNRDVWSIYEEVRVPFTSPTWNFPGLYSFEVDFAEREEWYSQNTSTVLTPFQPATSSQYNGQRPKVSVRWQPVDPKYIGAVTLRGSYTEAFHAPTLFEITPAGTAEFPMVMDPFSTSTPDVIEERVSGNPLLQPEVAYEWSYGLVYSPKWLKGLTVSADWWHIDLRSLISSLGAQFIIESNPPTPGVQQNGPLVFRGPTEIPGQPGPVTLIIDPNENLSGAIFEGLDYEAIYILDSGIFGRGDYGRLTLTVNGTWLSRAEFQPFPDTKRFGIAGEFAPPGFTLTNSLPWNRANFSLFYDGPADTWMQGLDVGVVVHWTGPYEDDNVSLTGTQSFPVKVQTPRTQGPFLSATGDPNPNAGKESFRARKLAAWTTVDLIGSYSFNLPPPAPASVPGYAKDGGKEVRMTDGKERNVIPISTAEYHACGWRAWLNSTTITLGMQNVFDEDPPFVASAFENGYDESLATIKGRFWYVQLKKRF